MRSTELEQALLLLPFDAARTLLSRILPLLPEAAPIELLARCTLFLIKVHHKQIVASRGLQELLQALEAALHQRLAAEQAVVGYNLAAMRFMRRTLESTAETKFFGEALEEHGKEGTTITELRRKTAARQLGSSKERSGKKRKPKPAPTTS